MDEFFGVPMNYIMFGVVAILGAGLFSVGLIALRNPVVFRIGIRNIPRRRAQTLLIVLGLMLSTLIVSAAFTTGDTVDRSLTSQVYDLLGEVDELVVGGASDDPTFADETQGITREPRFPASAGEAIATGLAEEEGVEVVVPGFVDVAVAVNLERRLSSPLFNLMGLDPAEADRLGELRSTTGGGSLRLADLGPDEIYLNESGAEDLDARPGDVIQVFTSGNTAALTVRDVVEDRRLAGSTGISTRREGGVVPLAVAQALFGAEGELTFVAISNQGDARGGVAYADQVLTVLESAVARTETESPLQIFPTKADAVDLAEESSSIMTTLFLVLGLFSIAAGVLLVFMIFVMLAAERKPEMGMARAIGTKRADIVQMFLSEGMVYNLAAALVGAALGVGVAFVIGAVMGAIFAEFGIEISPHVTVRSLVISYCLGGAVTFLTVTVSSIRVSVLNIVRAIRDIPEPPTPRPQWRGGVLVTLIKLIFKPQRQAEWEGAVAMLVFGLVIGGALAATGITALLVLGNVVIAIGALGFFFRMFQLGPVFLIGGLALLVSFIATDSTSAFLLLFGLSLTPLGLALIVRSFGANERLVYTLCGIILIYIWEFDFSVGLIEAIFGEAEGDIEMFFLSGVMVTVAATFLVVYNADVILGVLTRLGSGLGALLPSIKMAVAYPLANRMRTGLTMAMFTLVVFALVMMSAMNYNFQRAFLSDAARGGWDIVVDENPTNPIDDLEAGLAASDPEAAAAIESVGVSGNVTSFRAELCQIAPDEACGADADYENYLVRGVDAAYFETTEIKLQYRAAGYDSEAEVWEAVAADPSLAVIDAFALPENGGFGGDLFLLDDAPEANGFVPLSVRMRDSLTGETHDVSIIGIVRFDASATLNGVHVVRDVVEETFGGPDFQRYYVKLTPGGDATSTARAIESAFLTTGAQAESIEDQIDEQTGVFRSFFYLMQGFMGLGLLVGVAAVGVIAFRTVVERRQQIGMLRALGYTRRMIGMTFLIESAFIAFMGIASGIVFALILAWQLVRDELSQSGVSSFAVPVPQVALIGALAFGFALLMTVIPSRQAAGIPIAAALRYE